MNNRINLIKISMCIWVGLTAFLSSWSNFARIDK